VENTPEGHKILLGGCDSTASNASGSRRVAAMSSCRRRAAAQAVRGRGFPACQVRAYAKFHLQRARTTRAMPLSSPPAPRSAEDLRAPILGCSIREQLTMIDQINEDTARLKNRIESCRNARLRSSGRRIRPPGEAREGRTQGLVASIRKHPDLAKRLGLITASRHRTATALPSRCVCPRSADSRGSKLSLSRPCAL